MEDKCNKFRTYNRTSKNVKSMFIRIIKGWGCSENWVL